MWSHYAGAGDALAFVRVGTLDDATRVSPAMHIYTESKQPWVIIPDTQPAVERYYDYRESWPACDSFGLAAAAVCLRDDRKKRGPAGFDHAAAGAASLLDADIEPQTPRMKDVVVGDTLLHTSQIAE